MEQLAPARPIEAIIDDVVRNQTSLVELFVPANGVEQKRAFLAGEVYNPEHIYDRLPVHDYATREDQLSRLDQEIGSHSDILPHHVAAYRDYITESRQRNEFARAAATLHDSGLDRASRLQIQQEFMRLNIELFGAPDEQVYTAILGETKKDLSKRPSDPRAGQRWDELFARLPQVDGEVAAFAPSDETKEWVRTAALQLYYPLLRHVPKRQTKFTSQDIASIFTDIIESEFGGSADGWQVDLREAKAITVRSSEKLIIIPAIDRLAVNYKRMRGHVAHELGVHFFRSVMGAQTDIPLLRMGLARNGDNEEGLACVIEQAVENDFQDPSEMYPMVAGLMYFGGQDFRGCFEIMWRRRALLQLQEKGGEFTDEVIKDAREWAYYVVNRITRGTDTLPWFKDLSYYNGMQAVWRHLEEIRGDDMQLGFLLQGKADPTRPEHRRMILDAKTP